ncbi:hypothetical protein BGZ65_011326, partial [Modicella reniformis]
HNKREELNSITNPKWTPENKKLLKVLGGVHQLATWDVGTVKANTERLSNVSDTVSYHIRPKIMDMLRFPNDIKRRAKTALMPFGYDLHNADTPHKRSGRS